MTKLETDVAPNQTDMVRRAADFLLMRLDDPQSVGAVCLSGGETPRGLYRLLSSHAYVERIDWERIHWFFGDERFVPPDDPRSNARMAREALFSHAPAPDAHIHPMPTSGVDLRRAADLYQGVLQDFYGRTTLRSDKPLFDVVLLGLGADGHTASLFPGRREIDVVDRWVCPVDGADREPRLTLTLPALQSTRAAVFLVAGEAKQAALAKLRVSDPAIPASKVAPCGRLLAFVDAAAAGGAAQS